MKANEKNHFFLERANSTEFRVSTREDFPTLVFLHIFTDSGFRFCTSFKQKEARQMGMAFLDAMDEVAGNEEGAAT